jgi:hypothetical protein
MTRRLLTIGGALFALLLIVSALPVTSWAQQTIRNITVLSSALPTGASTSANQTTMIGHVDGLEGLIGTTNSLLTSSTAASTATAYTSLTTTVQTLSAGAGILDSFTCYNPNTAAAWLQVFNISGTVTLGTSSAAERYHIPAEQSFGAIAMSKNYPTAIKVAVTTTATGSGAPNTGLVCNFGHR